MVVEIPQRITRLTPLADALACIDMRVAPVAPRAIDVTHALDRTLSKDVVVAAAMPPKPVALRDGFAVRSELTHGASSYAPAPLAQSPMRVDAGDELSGDADAIAPFDAVAFHDGRAEIAMPVAPGDGVLPAAANAVPEESLCRTGRKLRTTDIAVLSALGIVRLQVREPRVRIVHAGAVDSAVAVAVEFIARAAQDAGSTVAVDEREKGADGLDAALRREDADAVIGIGGTGTGRNDMSVQILACVGQLDFHGVGLMPGETSAFGTVAKRPVLLLPGRLDATLAGWLVLGRRLLMRLNGTADGEEGCTRSVTLSRKIASTVGIAEVVPVRLNGNEVEPLATCVLPLRTLAHADGWVLVPAASEGYPAGTDVIVRPMP